MSITTFCKLHVFHTSALRLLIVPVVLCHSFMLSAQAYMSTSQKLVFFDYAELNAASSEFGYPEMYRMAMEMSIGLKRNSGNRSVSQIAPWFLNGFEKDGAHHRTVRLTGFGLNVATYYNVLKQQRTILAPGFTLGLRRYQLNLMDRREPLSVSQILSEPAAIARFSNYGVFFEPGMLFERFFYLGRAEYGVGLQVGYRFDMGEWRYEETAPMRGRMVRLSGLCIGWQISMRGMRESRMDRIE